MEIAVKLTVFTDAVKAEILTCGTSRVVGWFRDEVSGLSAVCEREIMRSAIIPEKRQLPSIKVETEYKPQQTGREVGRFVRGTTTKRGASGRRVVLLPGASAKEWLT